MRPPKNILATAVLLLLLLLSACATPEEAPPTPTEVVAATSAAPATPPPTTEPTAVPRPTITPEPTPIVPAITAVSQPLTEAGTLQIETVLADEAGWLVLLNDSDGRPGDILGYAAVNPGENSVVTLTLEPQAATPLLHLRLHRDAGDRGEFEFPGPDTAVEVAGQPVLVDLDVDIQLPIPEVTVEEQAVGPDGLVTIKRVLATRPSWLVVHSIAGEEIGPSLGQVTLAEGVHENIALPIRWYEASQELVAMLHEDAAQPGGFDSGQDLPVLIGGRPVSASFTVTLPPDIAAYDQPVVNGALAIERVTSPVPGWLVVYTTVNDQLDTIIGFAPLQAGVNEALSVEVVETAVTPQLYLLLHEDSGETGEFNFPAADLPLTYNEQLQPPVVLLTSPGNYLITEDQTLGEENEVTIPLVVTDLDTWVVIYTTGADGAADEKLGELWLPAGINRDSRVALDKRVTGEPLLAVLHRDAGTPREFDYPDGDDSPLQRNRQVIQSPFTLSEPSSNNAMNPGS